MWNKGMCRLSIIVPVHNMEKYIERCITSLLKPAFEGMEILCVDDGSTDGSQKICQEFALRDKRVKVIYQDNKGLPAARNTGIAFARGEYLSFVDADDWTDSRLFWDFVGLMDRNPDIDLCVGGAVRDYPDGSDMPMFEESPPQLFHRDEALMEMISGRIFFWHMWGRVYRRRIFEGFSADETVTTGEDLDSQWQLFQSGRICSVWYSPEYKYHYYFNTCGMTEGRKRMERYRSDLYVFEKILKGGHRESAEVMDQIRERALLSIYNILRELYFLNDCFEDRRLYLVKAMAVLDKMDAGRRKRSMAAQRLEQMVGDETYARNFFEKVFFSMRKVAAEAVYFPKKYIYGIGVVSQYVMSIMQENGGFDGFVISDGRPSTLMFAEKPVYSLSQLPQEEKTAVILGVNRKNQEEILEGLKVSWNTAVLIPEIPEEF